MNKKAWIVLVVAAVWCIGCWWWYVHKIKGKHNTSTEAPAIQENRPLSFRISTDTPIIGKGFQSFRDSIAASVGKNNLQITGLYFSDEKNTTSFPDLGAARADKVRALFKDKVAESQLVTNSEIDTFKYPAGRPDVFEGVQLTVVTTTTLQPVEEHGNHIIIYLPSKKIDTVVDTYLKQLATRLKTSRKSTLTIIGYSDSKGNSKSNYKAALKRAMAIKSELVKHGVNPKHISAKSGGDKNPIASNDTEEGRQKNRRVEITINNP
jgi:OmpA-OmpF porin, OOP family